MATGRSNKITQQIGEFLVCAELGKQGLIATPFAGSVPKFDIIVADEHCRSMIGGGLEIFYVRKRTGVRIGN